MLSKYTPKKLFLMVACGLLKHFVRQEDLLIISSKHGYVGNAAALVQCFISEKKTKYNIIWMGNKYAFPSNNELRYPVGLIAEAIVLCKAKVVFYTHSPSDVSVHLPKRIVRVNMWHGNPIKFILDDVPQKQSCYKIHKKRFLNQEPKDSDYFLCGGSRFKEIMSQCTGLPPNRILNTGLPRNKYFTHSEKALDTSSSFILFAPTFRDKNTQEKPILKLSRAWKEVYDLRGIKLVIKLHPNDKTDLSVVSEMGWIVVESNKSDVNDLMIASISLITDYSSIAFDYLMLSKPVFLLMEDVVDFTRNRGGFYVSQSELAGIFNLHESVDSLIQGVSCDFVFVFDDEHKLYNNNFKVDSLLGQLNL